jgi:hypothetical protein
MDTLRASFALIHELPWKEIKSSLELILYYLAVVAILGALIRLNTILRVIIEFNKGRGPLWDLRNTVTDIKQLEPSIQALRSDFDAIVSKIDATNKQLAELQVESIGNRLDVPVDGVPSLNEAPPGSAVAHEQADSDAENWTKLREHWRRNAERLEFMIDNIKDGRTKSAYSRLPRTNLTRIVNKLQGQKIISSAAAKASRELIDLFNTYRPRNRPVPDEVVGALEILEGQLDRELVPYAAVLAAQSAEDNALPLPQPAAPGPHVTRQVGHPQDADRPTA